SETDEMHVAHAQTLAQQLLWLKIEEADVLQTLSAAPQFAGTHALADEHEDDVVESFQAPCHFDEIVERVAHAHVPRIHHDELILQSQLLSQRIRSGCNRAHDLDIRPVGNEPDTVARHTECGETFDHASANGYDMLGTFESFDGKMLQRRAQAARFLDDSGGEPHPWIQVHHVAGVRLAPSQLEKESPRIE